MAMTFTSAAQAPASLRAREPHYAEPFTTSPFPSAYPPPSPQTAPYPYTNTEQQSSAMTSNSLTPSGDGASTSTAVSSPTPVPTAILTASSYLPVITPSPSTSNFAHNPSLSSTVQSTGLSNQDHIRLHTICIGDGIDASSQGVLAGLVVPNAIGLCLLLLFAILRPRFRQVYALREWFVPQDLRPRPQGSSFFAFFFPHVSLIPEIPLDISNAGDSTLADSKLFPSDEQLNQRVLWTAFLIALVWSAVGIAAALPLYLVATPCLAQLSSPTAFRGAYSTLQDLSLMRLLSLFDHRFTLSSNILYVRAESSDMNNAHVRLIVLTVLTIVWGVAPALWIITKELNTLIQHRKKFADVRCEGKEIGWLSVKNAPGFVGWGEKRLKDYLTRQGLSLSMESRQAQSETSQVGQSRRRQRTESEQQPLYTMEDGNLDVDVEGFFSIGDTQALALLIEERDEILENLEIAETKYISSFRVTTPEPSIVDFEPPAPLEPDRPYISRPLPLKQNQTRAMRGRRRRGNPAYAASSLAPTSFVAPSQYYKLRQVQGVSGGRFTDAGFNPRASVTESLASRVIGSSSRLFDATGLSAVYGRLPLANQTTPTEKPRPPLGTASQDGSWRYSAIPDPRRFGPNYTTTETQDLRVDETGRLTSVQESATESLERDWVDLSDQLDGGSEPNGPLPSGSRPAKKEHVPASQRETFPMRNDRNIDPDSVPPPHLRLQPAQPFVRPLDGLDFDDLGQVYADITQWRTKLKIINAEIAETQRDCYNDIADGAKIKGWLMIGRGVRYIPGIQLIEGRAKEDIRWDVLQNERGFLDVAVLLAVITIVIVLLAVGLTAVAGLALATSPDFTRNFSFLQPLLYGHPLATGVATVLAPAVAAIILTFLALSLTLWAMNIHGSTSVSGCQRFTFKITFFITTAVSAIWLVLVGALLFAMPAIGNNIGITKSLADGSIYMSILAFSIVTILAILFPALLLLQLPQLWHVLREERQAVTPRQRFRAIYPLTYDPSAALAPSVLAFAFASLFVFIFPLIGPAVVVMLLFTLIAHRFLVGYVYGRTHSQTGGLLQIWFLKRMGTLITFQPIALGLIFLTRELWIEGGILIGIGVAAGVFVDCYAAWKMNYPGRRSLSPMVQNALKTFEVAAWNTSPRNGDDESTSIGSSGVRSPPRIRGSMASVLEMMSVTLAVMPSNPTRRGPVPLQTETLDDLTATERAARTHPDAPPHLPPLPFTDHAEEMVGILYAPELIAPPPIIWLPNDSAGVARSEAVDLQRYHDLQVTLDVRTKEDVMGRRSSEPSR